MQRINGVRELRDFVADLVFGILRWDIPDKDRDDFVNALTLAIARCPSRPAWGDDWEAYCDHLLDAKLFMDPGVGRELMRLGWMQPIRWIGPCCDKCAATVRI
jgi:hypothetical protein